MLFKVDVYNSGMTYMINSKVKDETATAIPNVSA